MDFQHCRDFRARLQLIEATGEENRWYCSQAYGREITDPEVLMTYYIKNGGAEDFAERYKHAIGAENRWFCSEFYGRDIRDPEILWDYYIECGSDREESRNELSIA